MKRAILLSLILAAAACGQNNKPALGTLIDQGNLLAWGLVGCWILNETSGNLIHDISGNGYNMSTGTFSWAAGKFGSCLNFVGASSQYCEQNITVVSSSPCTVACWFMCLETVTGQTLVWIGDKDVSDHYLVGLRAAGSTAGDPIQLVSHHAGTDIIATTTGYTVGQWHLATAILRSTSDRSVYIDGGSRGNSAVTSAPHGMDRIAFGADRDSTPGTYFTGSIGSVMVWNRALSDAEIAELYRDPFAMFRPSFDLTLYGALAAPPAGGTSQVILISCAPPAIILAMAFALTRLRRKAT